MVEKRMISTGWLIDHLGLKGLRIGDAQVSEQHGNFLWNAGKATAEDMRALIFFIKTKAREAYGIELEEEVQMIGFDNVPLS
jgi:UDP-N-acetylmuramate dehydrogenase